MSSSLESDPKTFHFRTLHPKVSIGTLSDRYSGWLGQIYSRERYIGRISGFSKLTPAVSGNL